MSENKKIEQSLEEVHVKEVTAQWVLKSGQDLAGYRPTQTPLTPIHLPEDINTVLTISPVIGTDFITITYFHPELLATDKKIFLFLYVFFCSACSLRGALHRAKRQFPQKKFR